MEKNWQIKEANPALQSHFSQNLNIDPIIAQLLINRGILEIDAAKRFLSAALSTLYDPFLLKDMDKAIARIKQARAHNERVLIFGDYDVDGVVSTALLHAMLTDFGLDVINFIPHRIEQGYGLNHEIADFAKEKNVSLIITIDCGITACGEVDTINKLGIDVIIIDHHEPPDDGLPQALAIVNPKQKDCAYPFDYLASAGLVMKLYQALFGKVNEDYLDMVAIATIADIAPLQSENRIFVKHGLPRINVTKNKGLLALLDVAQIKNKSLSPYHIGFMLGPRINAAGRMDTAHTSLDLFLTDDTVEALRLAQQLDRHNGDRQRMQQNIVEEAFAIIEGDEGLRGQKVIVVSKEGWHEGLVGIVASKIKDKYYRPAIVMAIKDGVAVASARSVNGFHLQEALSKCGHCLENFGGHAGAAGLTIKEENIDTFRLLINEFAQDILVAEKLTPSLSIDCELPLSELNLNLVERVNALAPFGEGNPTPVFCTQNVRVFSAPQTLGKNTLKFWVSDGPFVFSAVGFGMGELKNQIQKGQSLDIAYELGIDDWNKAPAVQIVLKDIRLK